MTTPSKNSYLSRPAARPVDQNFRVFQKPNNAVAAVYKRRITLAKVTIQKDEDK
jgi:hypothetical protein